jgi:hypothetical protein
MIELKLRKVGGLLCTDWPVEAISHLKAKEGDTLYAIKSPYGFLITAIEPAAIDAMEEVVKRNESAYRELAKK